MARGHKHRQPSVIIADLAEVCRLAVEGKKPPAALKRRIRKTSQQVMETVQNQHGTVEIGAQIAREMRDAG